MKQYSCTLVPKLIAILPFLPTKLQQIFSAVAGITLSGGGRGMSNIGGGKGWDRRGQTN
jgi:hypothetical protein